MQQHQFGIRCKLDQLRVDLHRAPDRVQHDQRPGARPVFGNHPCGQCRCVLSRVGAKVESPNGAGRGHSPGQFADAFCTSTIVAAGAGPRWTTPPGRSSQTSTSTGTAAQCRKPRADPVIEEKWANPVPSTAPRRTRTAPRHAADRSSSARRRVLRRSRASAAATTPCPACRQKSAQCPDASSIRDRGCPRRPSEHAPLRERPTPRPILRAESTVCSTRVRCGSTTTSQCGVAARTVRSG